MHLLWYAFIVDGYRAKAALLGTGEKDPQLESVAVIAGS